MKWNIITHNLKGLNDPEGVTRERYFLTSLTQMIDVIMIQEYKLRGKAIEDIGRRLMQEYDSWILEAVPGEKNWINTNAADKNGLNIILSNKYARLTIEHGALYDNRLMCIKLKGWRQVKLASHVFTLGYTYG